MKELIDRRKFFKKSFAKILPIICISFISPVSVVAHNVVVNDCKNSCIGTCRGMCADGCTRMCGFGCDGKCLGTCKNSCQWTSKNANDTIKIKKDTIK